jgi:hypothetical protein
VAVVAFSLDERIETDDFYDYVCESFSGEFYFLSGVISLKSRLAVEISS